MTSRELLAVGAQELGIDLSIDQLNAIFLYLAELMKWNRKINLTAIRDERDIIIKHVLDSLSYLKGFVPHQGLKLLDMGSGAGFPGIPIKVARPEIAVSLVESIGKKAAFLRHCIRSLKIAEIEVMDMRLEELSASSYASYDIVTARAFAGMSSAVAAGAVFLKPGGRMVLSRGPEETINEQELTKAGVTRENRIDLVLPHSDYRRAIWVFQKFR